VQNRSKKRRGVQNRTINKKIGDKSAIEHKDGVQNQKGCKIVQKKEGVQNRTISKR